MTIEPLTLSTTAMWTAVCELEGIELPQRTMHEWMVRGFITPSIHKGAGRGDAAVWSLADVARVRLVARLRRATPRAISPVRVRAILAYLEAELREVLLPGSTASLVVDQARAYVVRPGQSDIEVPKGQLLLKFDSLFRGNEAAAKRAIAA